MRLCGKLTVHEDPDTESAIAERTFLCLQAPKYVRKDGCMLVTVTSETMGDRLSEIKRHAQWTVLPDQIIIASMPNTASFSAANGDCSGQKFRDASMPLLTR